MFQGIDLYSDTITRPTAAMKQAMLEAVLGDEQKGEDPTTRALEDKMANMLNKSSAMFFPSATMCNQVAVFLQTRASDEVIGADNCHIFGSEGGGIAFHSRVQARTIRTKDGTFAGTEVRERFRFGDSPHLPQSSLVLVENTTNAGGGMVWPKEKLSSVVAVSKELSLKLHLDGSRLFNAMVATSESLEHLTAGFDTVTICFSKGLGCPTGAILAFDREHWSYVRRLKQVFGGAMRQSGMLAAACLYALENHVEQLALDHKNARLLAEGLAQIKGVEVEDEAPKSNMVFFSIDEERMSPEDFLMTCKELGLRFSRAGANRFRAVTHRDVVLEQMEQAIGIVRKIFS